MYYEIFSSHITKRRLSITSKRQVRRKLFDKSSQDDAGGPENCMKDAGGSPETRDDVEGPENCIEDADSQRDIRNDAGGYANIRGGRIVNRRPI